jgi:hypothetical protein
LPLVGWQGTFLQSLTPASALLSIIGSVLICQILLLNRWRRNSRAITTTARQTNPEKLTIRSYERLMLGISVSDILASSRLILSTIAFRPFPDLPVLAQPKGSWSRSAFEVRSTTPRSVYISSSPSGRSNKTNASVGEPNERSIHQNGIGFSLASALVG